MVSAGKDREDEKEIEIIMSIFPPAIIGVKPSKMLPGEVGLFALRLLNKGTIINDPHVSKEKFFSTDVYKKLDKITQKVVADFCNLLADGFYSVPDVNYMPISWFCNHSCDPNAGMDKDGSIVLIKNVRGGVELTLDYGFYATYPDWEMECHCGSRNCRKIITGNDWKDPEFFMKNKKWMYFDE